jgi:hypothetical protein
LPPELVFAPRSNQAPPDDTGHATLDDQSRTTISVFIQALKPDAKPEAE